MGTHWTIAVRTVLRKRLRRTEVLSFFARLPVCLVCLEACWGAHYWAREAQKLGHTVRLMAPQYVKAYVKTNKTPLTQRRLPKP